MIELHDKISFIFNSFLSPLGQWYLSYKASPFISRANQWTDFCMIGTSEMKDFKVH